MKISGSLQPFSVRPSSQNPEPPVPPVEVTPLEGDDVVPGDGWAGINKPIKAKDADGNVYVAKSNTQGAFTGIYPFHNTHMDNVREIVASHIVADELKLPTLAFRQGVLVHGQERIEKVLSPLCKDFQTLEHASVKSIQDGDAAVGLAVTLGWMGDWDSTFNDSNVWVKNGAMMGADYGYSLQPGIEAAGVPFANVKVMKQFGTPENIQAATDRILALDDETITGMVHRQGTRWISDWTPEMEHDMAAALIHNRDEIKDRNPYDHYVHGFHPGLKQPLLKMTFPCFWWKAGHAVLPPLNRPDQYLDALEAISKFAHLGWAAKIFHAIRQHVPSPDPPPKP